MRKIVYGKMMDGYRNFHIITRGGGMCYGRFYEGSDWAYVHYRSHINGYHVHDQRCRNRYLQEEVIQKS